MHPEGLLKHITKTKEGNGASPFKGWSGPLDLRLSTNAGRPYQGALDVQTDTALHVREPEASD